MATFFVIASGLALPFYALALWRFRSESSALAACRVRGSAVAVRLGDRCETSETPIVQAAGEPLTAVDSGRPEYATTAKA
jgi:hypothetical protein